MFYIDHMREIFENRFGDLRAFVKTFGCQQNESDSEKICGFLRDIGFSFVDDPIFANFIVFNTCAVRHTAQDRIYGHIGMLKNIKKVKNNVFIAICGCMVELEDEKNEILSKYPYVDFVCGSKSFEKFPELLYENLTGVKVDKNYSMSVVQKSKFKAWVPIISGCNNFCSYCIVPYVRGREVSRKFEDILSDCKRYISNGAKIITFLGQNVNSYDYDGMKFKDLIHEADKIDGDFTIRFMTSHPKDLTFDLVDTLAECKHFSKSLHLPVQSGNNRILKLMNRKYTREEYIEKINYARSKIDGLVVSTDVIVGFPSETNEEFEDTVSLIQKVRFFSIFSFIYSKRNGTLSAKMEDLTTHKEKTKRINRLINIQNKISEKLHSELINKNFEVFVEGNSDGYLICRTFSNLIVKILDKKYSYGIGDKLCVKIVSSGRNALYAELLEKS